MTKKTKESPEIISTITVDDYINLDYPNYGNETKYDFSTYNSLGISFIDYKYNEGQLIREIQSYIDSTYNQHYSKNKYQATEFIIDAGHGTGFNIGNMMKYTQRYGRKGDPAEWRKDLMKVIHYAIMQLHVHDTEYKD